MTTESRAHHISIEPQASHVRISVDGVVLAETERPVVLKEGKLPPRFYIAPDDVQLDLLEGSDSTSHCPFKGDASYWSYGGRDVAWTYREPIPGAEGIKGLIAFYNEKVDIEVDGETH